MEGEGGGLYSGRYVNVYMYTCMYVVLGGGGRDRCVTVVMCERWRGGGGWSGR